MQRTVKALAAVIAVAILGSGCVIYSTGPSGNGTLSTDGLLVRYTLHASYSQLLNNLLYGTCNGQFACYEQIVVAEIGSDAIGQHAIIDYNPLPIPTNGVDEVGAIANRLLDQPGGYPNAEWPNRCLSFDVYPVNPTDFVPGTWHWWRPGVNGCSA